MRSRISSLAVLVTLQLDASKLDVEKSEDGFIDIRKVMRKASGDSLDKTVKTVWQHFLESDAVGVYSENEALSTLLVSSWVGNGGKDVVRMEKMGWSGLNRLIP